ncbi:glycosyltransferase family 2 protein [Hungatella hathewayi]|uniref:glycosyltransferase family 2 protein n=1 Tax=Hungatella hathewayi TaxID=154046 RepID=UPI000335011D|nr:glycosyltransferase family 2 protein [Hungatella hathewayi]CCZ60371.1 glycosyl transferase family 2 [Hungatella hathewayi CAG:224]
MKLQILLSTYNGEKYICTQLDSIVTQDIEEKELLIRDDGSNDRTVPIIKTYMELYPWIILYEGKNIGVQRSFFDLLNHADLKADYFAFADQDDEWFPEKMKRAIEKLKLFVEEKPALYCSDKVIVDEKLNPINLTVPCIVHKITFANALVQNICTGCTVVFNREMLFLLQQYVPEEAVMHDWWSYLLASAFGNVYYDSNAYIHYRQHGENVTGAQTTRIKLLKYRIGELKKPRGALYKQARELSVHYKLPNDKQEIIDKFLSAENSFIARIRLLQDKRFYRQKKGDDLVFRLIVLLGKL